jgi:allantoin racemase
MPTALVINPNTTADMTEKIRQRAAPVFPPPWELRVVQPPGGAESIESWFESYLSAVAMLPVLKEYPDVDGIVLACFGDPGLFAFREIVHVPVVGIAEASYLTACLVGLKFGVIVGSAKDAACLEEYLWSLGLQARCAGFEWIDMAVLEMAADRKDTLARLAEAAHALKTKGAESSILGCANLGDFREDLERESRMPVIDPVEAACWQLRALVEMRLKTSRASMFETPARKRLTDLDRVLSPDLARWLSGRAASGFEG